MYQVFAATWLQGSYKCHSSSHTYTPMTQFLYLECCG